MACFPVFVDLTGKPVTVVGGGHVAELKVRHLLPYGPEITVVAPEIEFDLPVKKVPKPVEETDLTGVLVVSAADKATNAFVSRICAEKGILCNVVDDQAASSFIMGANILEGDLSIGVNTDGASPMAAVALRDEIKKIIPEDLPAILDCLKAFRPKVKEAIDSQPERADIFRSAYFWCMEQGGPLDEEQEEELLHG